MSEEPMFAGLKKKSKKTRVNFEDIELEGNAGTTTQSLGSDSIKREEDELDTGIAKPGDEAPAAIATDEAPADGDMFADLKKKSKKKKAIPMDLEEVMGSTGEADATPAASADADMGEFGDLKKKKKSSKKKAAFDLEAFEKEVCFKGLLNHSNVAILTCFDYSKDWTS